MEKNGSKSFQLWFPLLAVHGSQQSVSLKIFSLDKSDRSSLNTKRSLLAVLSCRNITTYRWFSSRVACSPTLRACSFYPLHKGIGRDWRGLMDILNCWGFNPSQPPPIPFNHLQTEQALTELLSLTRSFWVLSVSDWGYLMRLYYLMI